MLFDLRARGRRRTVQAVYLGLALLIGGGLVLFGVGTGSGVGGLLNAFTNGKSSGSGGPAVSQAEKAALHQTQLHPSSQQAWIQLINARVAAGDQNCSGTACTAAGHKKLEQAGAAWQRYIKLTKNPSPVVARTIATSYEATGNFKQATAAWMVVTQADPNTVSNFELLARDAYAAKETRVGDLAAQKAVSLVPKSQRKQLQKQLQQLKSSAATSSSATGGSTSGSATGG
ncbi:MAG: tetratricopeptide repeat protein [Solirubrobacteraceae bacterium]